MSGVILPFARQKPAATVNVALPEKPRYFCLRCDGDNFKLYSAGIVHCANCGALTRNLSVEDSDRPAA